MLHGLRHVILQYSLHHFGDEQACQCSYLRGWTGQEAMDRGQFSYATAAWGAQQAAVGNLTDNVDWYNALLHNVADEASAGAAQWSRNTPGAAGTLMQTA